MKIAFIVNEFPSLSETFVLNQITGLLVRGQKIEIFARRRGNMQKVHNEINQFDIPKSVHYRYYESLLPKRKHYFKYIKKKKDVNQEDKKLLCKYFECGMKEIDNYIIVLPEKEIKGIINSYRTT